MYGRELENGATRCACIRNKTTHPVGVTFSARKFDKKRNCRSYAMLGSTHDTSLINDQVQTMYCCGSCFSVSCSLRDNKYVAFLMHARFNSYSWCWLLLQATKALPSSLFLHHRRRRLYLQVAALHSRDLPKRWHQHQAQFLFAPPPKKQKNKKAHREQEVRRLASRRLT
jgi:hypothetical protein